MVPVSDGPQQSDIGNRVPHGQVSGMDTETTVGTGSRALHDEIDAEARGLYVARISLSRAFSEVEFQSDRQRPTCAGTATLDGADRNTES